MEEGRVTDGLGLGLMVRRADTVHLSSARRKRTPMSGGYRMDQRSFRPSIAASRKKSRVARGSGLRPPGRASPGHRSPADRPQRKACAASARLDLTALKARLPAPPLPLLTACPHSRMRLCCPGVDATQTSAAAAAALTSRPRRCLCPTQRRRGPVLFAGGELTESHSGRVAALSWLARWPRLPRLFRAVKPSAPIPGSGGGMGGVGTAPPRHTPERNGDRSGIASDAGGARVTESAACARKG